MSRSVLVRFLTTALVASTVLSFASACGGKSDKPSTVAAVVDAPSVYRLDRDKDGIPDQSDQCPDKAEDSRWTDPATADGCPDTINDLIDLSVSDIGDYWQRAFDEAGGKYRGASTVVAYTEPIKTACGTALMENAFYCSLDRGVYYDATFLGDFLQQNGDFAVAFVIAHEWGHLVQDLIGRLDKRPTIDKELEADCLAGTWTADADSREILDAGDINEAIITLLTVGDPLDTPVFDPQAHGTPGLRIDAFDRGVEQGLDGCFSASLRPGATVR